MKRLKPVERKRQILIASMVVAKAKGYNNITRELVAKEAGVAPGLVNKYFGTMRGLKRAIMRTAIKDEIFLIILDGILSRDSQALKINADLRLKAFALIQIDG